MVTAVLLFGALNILFEFVLIGMMSPKVRLRLLGNRNSCSLLHFGFLLGNLIVHWGTVTGTMSAVMAFVASIVTVEIARRVFGFIVDGRYYTVGIVKYAKEELV